MGSGGLSQVEIEFDPAKDAANIAKHGISLARAAEFEVVDYEQLVRRGETRIQALGTIGGIFHSLTFVFRRNAVRAISLRRAHNEEVERMAKKNQGFQEGGQAAFNDEHVVFDDDNPEWTAERLARAHPASELPPEILAAFPKTLARLRGQQKAPTKIAVSLRLSPEVVDHFKAGGAGWQTRIDEALRQIVKKAG